MNEQLTTVTRKGQITVPARIREALGLKLGDKVAISLEEDGTTLHATLRPVRSVTDMTFGAIPAQEHPVDTEVVRTQWMEDAAERDARSKHQ